MLKFLSIILCILLLFGCSCNSKEFDRVLSSVNAEKITSYTAESHFDVGFHGDGKKVYIFSDLNETELNSTINQNDMWIKYSENSCINCLIYGMEYNNVYFDKIIDDIPELINGYYYFNDLQNPQNIYSNDDIIKVYQRNSMNFVLAVIDSEKRVLYYIGYDT